MQPALIIVRFDAETATITAAWRLIETRSGAIYNIRAAADMERPLPLHHHAVRGRRGDVSAR